MTTPKTWQPYDPSLADNMGDYVRNNLDFLRERQEDLMSSVKDLNTFKAQNLAFQAAAVHYVVYQMSRPRYSSSSFARVHPRWGITLTPLTDLLLFTVQFDVGLNASGRSDFGVWKDEGAYSLNYSTSEGSEHVFHRLGRGDAETAHYTVPVTVTRNQQVSLYPAWSTSGKAIRTGNNMPMILLVQDVGSYG